MRNNLSLDFLKSKTAAPAASSTSPTWEEHLEHLEQVVRQIHGSGLIIKPGKCQIGLTKVQYLSHQLGGGTLKPQLEKVDAITSWPTPKTKKQVMSFLGMAGYYKKFIPNYSALPKPLTDLTKKKLPKTVNCTADCEWSFTALTAALASSPVIQAPEFTQQFVVQTHVPVPS
ncbi:uncharacterized protein [Phyllobates terribilis]|uniref:uncharacterized protein n=1 Tax=Phyllobates terribilis TaxID=111132 RepID=UPI003CCB63CE